MSNNLLQELLGDGDGQASLKAALTKDYSSKINEADETPSQGNQTSLVPYKSLTYQREKSQGLRRANGARKLKKLSGRHLDIISRHLQGASGEQIAQAIGCTIITVSRVLNDPMAKHMLAIIYKDRQNEIDALAGNAIAVVREALVDSKHPMRVKLAAVDKFSKLKDSIGKDSETTKTAEDVVQEIFAGLSIKGDNVQINIGQKDD